MKRPPVLLAVVCLLLLAIPPVVLQAAVSVTEEYAGTTTAAAASYTTNIGGTGPLTLAAGAAPFSIAAGSILYCGVVWSGATPGTVSLSYDGDTMTQLTTTTFDTTKGMSTHYIVGPRTSSHVQITPSSSPNGMGLACYEVAGVNTGSLVIQSKSGNGTLTPHTVTMDGPRTANSVLFHWVAVEGVPSFTAEYSGAGTGLTYSSPSTRGKMQWDIGSADITPLITTDVNVVSARYAVEFAEASASAGAKPSMLMLGVGEQ
jgi:multisubunit Na+/H+ antiporter MnhE subunit